MGYPCSSHPRAGARTKVPAKKNKNHPRSSHPRSSHPHQKSFSKTTTRDGQRNQSQSSITRWIGYGGLHPPSHGALQLPFLVCERAMKWRLKARRGSAPASVPAPPPAPAVAAVAPVAFDINIPLRVPRTLRGRYISKDNRLLRARNLNSEMHESAFQSSKSILVECMNRKCTGKFRLTTYTSYIITM